jgi:hypothetical protein
MSDDSAPVESSSEPQAGAEQRLEQLEKAGKLNRLLIYGLAGALLLNLIGWVLVAVLSGSSGPDEETLAALASKASVDELQKEVAALQLQAGTLQQQIKDQQRLMLAQAEHTQKQLTQQSTPAAEQPQAREQDKDNVRMLARTLIGQERNYQQTLLGLKEGMRELAGMTAGSRSWLEFYEESLAKPMADSQARVKALQAWESKQAAAR